MKTAEKMSSVKREAEAGAMAFERKLDLVYQLYDLTPEEIAVVEESTRAK